MRVKASYKLRTAGGAKREARNNAAQNYPAESMGITRFTGTMDTIIFNFAGLKQTYIFMLDSIYSLNKLINLICTGHFIRNFFQFFQKQTGMTRLLSLQKLLAFIITLAVLYFGLPAPGYAQYYNQTPEFLKANGRWAFGGGTGLEFSSGTARTWSNSVSGSEGYAAVSSRTTGNLLFYSNGETVWRPNGSAMLNGNGLKGNRNTMISQYTTLQGTLIVPFINDTNKYYLFSMVGMGEIYTDFSTGKNGTLFYNIIDMSLDNGNGGVDPNNKNIILDDDPLGESLIAVPGCNNDVWVITHSDVYKAYHITESGLNTSPVLSASKISSVVGSLTISPDLKKIVATNSSLDYDSISHMELADFDPSSGVVSNSIRIVSEKGGYFMAAFSPDNSKLYTTNFSLDYSTGALNGNMIQFDIANFDSARIAGSKQIISSSFPFGSLRLYNDTIYATSYFFNLDKVHRINQPDKAGTACDFQLNAVSLSGSNPGAALGSEVVFTVSADTIATFSDTIICRGWEDGVFLTAKDTSLAAYTWSTGDTTSSARIEEQGTYWVKYKGCNKVYIDTILVKGSDLFTTITIEGFRLSTSGGPFESYQWYFNGEAIPGATESIYTVTENGDYTVEVTDGYGCVFRSEVYKVTNVSIGDIKQLMRSVSVYPNPATDRINIEAPLPVQVTLTGIDGKEQIKEYGARSVSISSLTPGIYFVKIATLEGEVLKTLKIVRQ